MVEDTGAGPGLLGDEDFLEKDDQRRGKITTERVRAPGTDWQPRGGKQQKWQRGGRGGYQ